MLLAPAGDRREFLRVDDRAGRVARAGDDEAGRRLGQGREHGHGRLEPGVRTAVELDDPGPKGLQRVAVCRVARTAHRHRVSDVERGEEQRGEGRGRAGRDDDLVGVDGQPVVVGIVPRNRLTQRPYAGRLGIAEHLTFQRGRRGGPGCGGCWGRGLTCAEGDDITVGGLSERGSLDDLHDMERLHGPTAGEATGRHTGQSSPVAGTCAQAGSGAEVLSARPTVPSALCAVSSNLTRVIRWLSISSTVSRPDSSGTTSPTSGTPPDSL